MKKNKKGFTLAELLIVVAIIGVLVAISIPIFNNQLKKARLATNQANARAAYAAWVAQYIDEGMPYLPVMALSIYMILRLERSLAIIGMQEIMAKEYMIRRQTNLSRIFHLGKQQRMLARITPQGQMLKCTPQCGHAKKFEPCFLDSLESWYP